MATPRPATTWLIRAFAPGCPTMLRSWASKPGKDGGEVLSIVYDLPTDDAARIARAMAKSAQSLTHVRIGRDCVRHLKATVHGRHRTLTVDALLVNDRRPI